MIPNSPGLKLVKATITRNNRNNRNDRKTFFSLIPVFSFFLILFVYSEGATVFDERGGTFYLISYVTRPKGR